jgi:chromosome segregation ATPase
MTTIARIFEIADELDATGQNPTLATVRKMLGGGSYTTISQAMNEWRTKKAAKETPIREAAPQAITELLEQLGMEVWGQALQLANGRLSTEREALEKTRQEIEAQRQEAAELADQVSSELETARQEATLLREQWQAEQITTRTLGETLRERERDLAVAQARTEEINTRATQLHEQLTQATAQNADLVRTITEVSKKQDKPKMGAIKQTTEKMK